MKWTNYRQSDNVDDRRGLGPGRKLAYGGSGLAILLLILNYFLGGDSTGALQTLQEQVQQSTTENSGGTAVELTPEQEEMGRFVKAVFAMTEDTWDKIFHEEGLGTYDRPGMVLFTGNTETGCGSATSASGPFYCPADQKVYMDLDFFNELRTRFGAKGGDFAIAYVIAHEVGHHVQTLLGTSDKVHRARQNGPEREANRLSVCLELQADFYAGLWAAYNQDKMEVGDLDEAIDAANAVGDDAIQSKMTGEVQPETFTHGTSAQRKRWFRKGFETRNFKAGNTFGEEM